MYKLLLFCVALFAAMEIYQFTREKSAHTPASPAAADVHVNCETTKGPLEITVKPEWSPLGARRFLELVDDGYFTHLPLFRCIEGFVCQFGAALPGPPRKTYAVIADDPPRAALRAFKPGYLSFAGYGPHSRATHIFIALNSVPSLGTQPWETPFGFVSELTFTSTVKQFNTSYGETAPRGHGPEPQKIEAPNGAMYLQENFPQLDYFMNCSRSR